MIIYNETYNVEFSIEKEWLHWIRQQYIPRVVATDLSNDQKILRLLTEVDSSGATYSIQLTFDSMEYYFTYQNECLLNFRQEMSAKYPGKYFTFSTLLEVV
jgi:Domain of unknown function (DUF4286)